MSNPIYFTVPNDQDNQNYEDDEHLLKEHDGVGSKRNFWCFCILFAIVHAAVDAVLAFSAAELGTKLGSSGGFTLYIFYTTSAFFIAKPLLQWLGAKRAVFFGLLGMLAYVASFFLSILYPALAVYVFLLGAGIGGLGAGVLWTAQGSYFAANAYEYTALVECDRDQVLTQFAATFAAFYLSFETCFKFVATMFFLSSTGSMDLSWRPTVFGLYATSAAIAIVLYYFIVQDFEHMHNNSTHSDSVEVVLNINLMSGDKRRCTIHSVCMQLTTVGRTLLTNPKLCLLLPYQLCFGFSVGLLDTYVNGVIVSKYIGDGYIGLLAGITTLTAALLASPYSLCANRLSDGGYLVMILGGLCFCIGGVMLVVLSDQELAYWPIIITYYVIHGAARGVWESTNKAMVSIYFSQPDTRDAAYAAVYFTSGLAGALGFIFFQFLSKVQIAVFNVFISLIAIVCFHISYVYHQRAMQLEQLANIQSITRTFRSDSESSLDTLTGGNREREQF
ncbi:hypothetical protein EON65_17125 [archaeon]|nr:MAG: hypothetical protein EON65_17125 [archaeon]